ncbi:MAG: hypothetical protein HGB18_00025 [Candidatus Moranbacteria bacterium]|nr:hypothetical protein [Candidatus Moranbacteria bacterium]
MPMTPNFTPQVLMLLLPVVVWSLVWKGVALWKAARNGHTAWFVALLILNTVGILEIIYIVVFSKGNQVETPRRDVSTADDQKG